MANSSFFGTSGTTATVTNTIQTSVDAAATSATNAETAKTAAEAAQTAAETAQAAAETAETNAETAQTAAETAKTAAETAETNAETAESNASSSASSAATQATNAATSATNAATSATNAASSETAAGTSETNAATSATNAASSASAASTSASAASSSATAAASSASAASTSETNASSSASSASTSASNASTSETNAATSATNATSSASAASTSASNASTSATNASNSASAASTSATNAASSASSAASSLSSFNAIYSSGASDPSTNLDTGDLFFNTTSSTLKVYTGSGWEQGVTAGSGFLPTTGGSLTGNVTTTGTFDGRDVAADGTKLDGIEAGATADQTAAEILTAVKSVDGALSGLDADLLDGEHGSYYLDANNFSNMPSGYSGWTISDGTNSESIADGNTLTVSGSGATSASYNTSTNTLTISSTDNNTTYSNATTSAAGLMSSSDKTKLDGVESGATADQTASEILTAIKTVDGAASGLDADLLDGVQGANYALLASPSFTGTPTAPTAAADTSTTQIATTAFVQQELAQLVDSAPSTLDTLNEIAAAINDDANFNTTVTNSLANRVRVDTASQGLTSTQKSNARTNLGLATVASSGAYSDLSGTPTIPTNNNQLTNGAGYITSADGGNAATLDSIDSSQFLRSDQSDSMSGNLTVSGDVTATDFNATSDEMLKSNIRPIENALDKVAKMNGMHFVLHGREASGVIAQNIREIAPEAVTDTGEHLTVGYNQLIGYLIEAVKELKTEIEELKNGSASVNS